jgi:cytochrome c biogenesis protein CcdA
MSLSIWTLTIPALLNGLNPCGIGLLATFLGYLLVFRSLDKKKVLLVGVLYILGFWLTYVLLGLFFYRFASSVQWLEYENIFRWTIASVLWLVAVMQIKEVIRPGGMGIYMPKAWFEKWTSIVSKSGVLMAPVLGVVTAGFSTPCMLPLYAGMAMGLSNMGLSEGVVLGYFLYYNLIFVSPWLVILTMVIAGYRLEEVREWQHKSGNVLKIALAVLMVLVGYYLVSY